MVRNEKNGQIIFKFYLNENVIVGVETMMQLQVAFSIGSPIMLLPLTYLLQAMNNYAQLLNIVRKDVKAFQVRTPQKNGHTYSQQIILREY